MKIILICQINVYKATRNKPLFSFYACILYSVYIRLLYLLPLKVLSFHQLLTHSFKFDLALAIYIQSFNLLRDNLSTLFPSFRLYLIHILWLINPDFLCSSQERFLYRISREFSIVNLNMIFQSKQKCQ